MRLAIVVFVGLLLAACGAPSQQTLESALIQDGDLPTGYTAGQITDGAGLGYAEGFDLRVAREISPVGYVMVMLYRDKEAQAKGFDAALPGATIDGKLSTEVGEQAHILGGIIVFMRCSALVQMQVGNPEQAMSYAKRLDNRLQSMVC